MGCIRRLNCLSYAESICCHPWIWTRLKDSFIYTKWGKGSWEMMLRAEINPEEFAGCITEQKPSRWTIYVGIIKSRRFIICAGRYVASYRFYVIILFIFLQDNVIRNRTVFTMFWWEAWGFDQFLPTIPLHLISISIQYSRRDFRVLYCILYGKLILLVVLFVKSHNVLRGTEFSLPWYD